MPRMIAGSRVFAEMMNRHRRLYILLIGALLSAAAMLGGCGSSDGTTTLNGYPFSSDSATLTNRYFPAIAGEAITFTGYGSFAGTVYTWTFSPGETVQGVATLRERGTVTNAAGDTTIEFDSMLAQDIRGNVHVLKNVSGGTGTLSGVAAGLAATLLMPGDPRVGDSFGPSADYTGTVLSLDETVGSYTGVLHSLFVVEQGNNTRNRYDDYWAPGVGQVKSTWSLADGTSGYWLRVEQP
ncbi:MAG: hypothetical protein ACYC7J_20715 [Syntrophales bacterium]